MSDFTFWSDVSTVISYTYSSSSVSHTFLRQSLLPFLCILSIFGIYRRASPYREAEGSESERIVARIRHHTLTIWAIPMEMKSMWSPTPFPAMFNAPTELIVFIYSNTSFGFFITPLDWIHPPTCMDPYHLLKTHLWDTDYSASLI